MTRCSWVDSSESAAVRKQDDPKEAIPVFRETPANEYESAHLKPIGRIRKRSGPDPCKPKVPGTREGVGDREGILSLTMGSGSCAPLPRLVMKKQGPKTGRKHLPEPSKQVRRPILRPPHVGKLPDDLQTVLIDIDPGRERNPIDSGAGGAGFR
jgi:hypothetical protein